MTEDPSLTPELKDAWLRALRSGEYKQGTGRLHSYGEYCCLGVLLCVAGFTHKQMGSSGTIGEVSVKLAREIEGNDWSDDKRVALENMNDGVNGERRHSFEEIANFIEHNL